MTAYKIFNIHLIVLLTSMASPVYAVSDTTYDELELFELSLEELTNVSVLSTNTLTRTSARQAPAAITTITQEDIRRSGARQLDELLDIYVPGYQFMKKQNSNAAGIRGTISDRNNKLLMLVNGRNMNIKARDSGAVTERHLSMLGDIKNITIVRGPGSSVYGPGAIAGIINIETYNGSNFEGTELSARGGAFENFVNAEIKYGKKFENDFGLFAYYGIDHYIGADQSDSPVINSHAFTAANGQDVIAGQPTPFAVLNSNSSFKDQLRHKAHLQLTGNNIDLWARYTRGGDTTMRLPSFFRTEDPTRFTDTGMGYQQLTFFAGYEQLINRKLKIDYSASYDLTDMQVNNRGPGDNINFFWREDEYTGKLMVHWTPTANHQIAIGSEVSYEIFGKDSLQQGETSHLQEADIPDGTDWETTMYSFLGEYQWTINQRWLTIAGIRTDKHTYTPWMFSPRIALIHTPNDSDTYKAILNHSVRRSDDSDLFRAILQSGIKGEVESIDNAELRYERQHSNALWLGTSAYYNDHTVVSYDNVSLTTKPIGKLQTYGFELEGKYQADKARFMFSHNYSKHLDFDLTRNTTIQNLSVSTYGFGNDLANWSNHSTKLTLEYDFTKQWTGTASARVYWGYPGAEDTSNYNNQVLGANDTTTLSDGSTRAFEEQIYLNTGLEYHPDRNMTIRLDSYNLLGLLDEDLNKRNQFNRAGTYRVEAPAIALSINIKLWD